MNLDINLNILTITEKKDIWLQKNEAIAVSLFSNDLNQEINTFDLQKNGISSPAQCIWRLKQKGAIIISIRKTISDSLGKLHYGIACYQLMGWQ